LENNPKKHARIIDFKNKILHARVLSKNLQ